MSAPADLIARLRAGDLDRQLLDDAADALADAAEVRLLYEADHRRANHAETERDEATLGGILWADRAEKLREENEALQARLGICLGVMTVEQRAQAERYLATSPTHGAALADRAAAPPNAGIYEPIRQAKADGMSFAYASARWIAAFPQGNDRTFRNLWDSLDSGAAAQETP